MVMQRVWTTIISGLALFAMFFGAGNLVFPLLLGQAAGSGSLAPLVDYLSPPSCFR